MCFKPNCLVWRVLAVVICLAYRATAPGTTSPSIVPTSPPVLSPTVYMMSTLAGIAGASSYSGDRGLATSAHFTNPTDVYRDSVGVTYVADQLNHRIRIIGTDNIITTFAGTGVPTTSGNSVSATIASFTSPISVWGDTNGKVYVSDYNTCNVRVIVDGIITYFAGMAGSCSTSSVLANGDGGPATSATMATPVKLCGDRNSLFVAEKDNYKIRKVSALGIMSTVAGSGSTGSSGDNGKATSAKFQLISAVFVDTAGNIFVPDGNSNIVRKVDAFSSIITTYVGSNGVNAFNGDGLAASSTYLNSPIGVWGGSDASLFVVDSNSARIRWISSNSIVYTVAGNGVSGTSSFSTAMATAISFGTPSNVFVDSVGNAFFADLNGAIIRKMSILNPTASPTLVPTLLPSVSPSYAPVAAPFTYMIYSLVGTGYLGDSGNNGNASAAQINSPVGMWVDSVGATYFTDQEASHVRKVSKNGIISLAAGYGTLSGCPGGGATTTSIRNPYGIAGDSNGKFYFTELQTIQVVSSGVLSSYAGSCDLPSTSSTAPNGDNGPASAASFNQPGLMCSDSSGYLYVVDESNRKIRRISLTSNIITTVIGTGEDLNRAPEDGVPATSTAISDPLGLAVDSMGSLYYNDNSNSLIRKMNGVSKLVTTVAGTGYSNFNGYSGAGTSTNLGALGLWADSLGNLFIGDVSNAVVRMLSSNGIMFIVAGTVGSPIDNGNGLSATAASLSSPEYVFGNAENAVLIAEPQGHVIRRLVNISPTQRPTVQPSSRPSSQPSRQPICRPTSRPSIRPTRRPSTQPTRQPSGQPTSQPSSHPTVQPSKQPVSRPTNQPTEQPSSRPTSQPTSQPSRQPSSRPSSQPTRRPSTQPSSQPTIQPAVHPTTQPSVQPSRQPSSQPSVQPTKRPTTQPSVQPSVQPVAHPSRQPSSRPTSQPSRRPSSQPSNQPSSQPLTHPTCQPSSRPTCQPSGQPSNQPSRQPSEQPTQQPTMQPSVQPSSQPSVQPFSHPSGQPSSQPLPRPSSQPTRHPSAQPLCRPSAQPTNQPSRQPSSTPTIQPTRQPSTQPIVRPTGQPSRQPSSHPTNQPSRRPSGQPSSQPSAQPLIHPSCQPSSRPTFQPSCQPSAQPSRQPSCQPISRPTGQPSSRPSHCPSVQPSRQPSSRPTCQPTEQPSRQPTVQPSSQPTGQPSTRPSVQPLAHPSAQPTHQPTAQPSRQPSSKPSHCPSRQPSDQPTAWPTEQPSSQPSGQPSVVPSLQPLAVPTAQPSVSPSQQPTDCPTSSPSQQPIAVPSSQPSEAPTSEPSAQPAAAPSSQPSSLPSGQPSAAPSSDPSGSPTEQPSSQPTHEPSVQPSDRPSLQPASSPTVRPSTQPSASPSAGPTSLPSSQPSHFPSSEPSVSPSSQPSSTPSVTPSRQPSSMPSAVPTSHPTRRPSSQPSTRPTAVPSCRPSHQPVGSPSSHPSSQPASVPSDRPSLSPSCSPSSHPSRIPSSKPSSAPSIRPTLQPYSKPSSQPSCLPSQEPTRLPTPRSQYPLIDFRVLQTNRTSLLVKSHLNYPGVVYCAAISVAEGAPSSVESLKMMSFLSLSDRNNETRIVVQGLVPVTSYQVFCLAESFSGAITPLVDVLSSGLLVSTQCCKTLSLSISSAVITGRNVLDFLSINVDALPSAEVKASLTLLAVGGAPIEATLVPSQITLTPSSTALTSRISLPPLPVGTFECSVALSGGSVGEYSLSTLSLSFLVIGTHEPLPAPVLQSAAFSSDGSYVVVAFNSKTNWGNTSSVFSCPVLFDFTCADTSQCQWVSPSVVRAYVTPEEGCASPGDVFSLLPGSKVLAQCLASAGCTTESSAASPVSLSIAAPVAAAVPLITISAPSTIGSCDSLTIDLTASSGHGGRSWSRVSLSVQPGLNSEVIQSFLDTNYVVSPPVAIPASLLAKNTSYGFVVTMCNFLESCSSASYKVSVQLGAVPVVTLPGISLRTVSRSSLLTITSRASITFCDAYNASSSALTYHWFVDGVSQNELMSTSKDSSRLRLPPFSLTVGQLYTMTLTVSAVDAAIASSTASVQVFVQRGALIAVVSSGSSLPVVSGSTAVIDASQSYDEDVNGLVEVEAGLSFVWACSQTSPQLSESCDSILSSTTVNNGTRLEVVAGLVSTTATALVSVTISDSSASRSTSASIEVSVLPSNSPLTKIASNMARNQMNRRQLLTLTGTVSLPPHSECNATWSVNDTSVVSLQQVAQSPVVTRLLSVNSTTVALVYLVLPGNSLPSLGWYGGFSLTCQLSPTLSAVSSVVVAVNSCPAPGSFSVITASGAGYFDFAAYKWTDSDLPLSYQFGVISTAGTPVVLLSKSEFTHGTALVSGGAAASNFTVLCFAMIFDSLLNNASAYATVQVVPSVSFAVGSLLSDSSSFQSSDKVRQVTAFVSASLNAVDCTLTPNCSALHRSECLATQNTCGACTAGYLGDGGDSNSMCVSTNKLLMSGGVFEICSEDGSCQIPPKQCTFNCSDHGVCSFVNSGSGLAVVDCRIGDVSCAAVCQCDVNHSGVDCSLTTVEMEERQRYRQLLISLVSALVDKEDADEQSVESWINSLSDSIGDGDELSAVACEWILNVTAAHISLSSAVGLSVSSSEVVLSNIDSVASAVAANSDSEMSLSGVAQVQALLQQYFQFVASDMVPTQTALSVLYSQFRGEVQSNPVGNVSMTEPQSSLEVAVSSSAATVSLPFTSSDNVTASTALRSSLLVYHAGLFSNVSSLKSNPVRVVLSHFPCAAEVECNLQLELPFTQPLSDLDLAPRPAEWANITCVKGLQSFLNYTCNDGQTLHLMCNGSFAGVFRQQCPLISYSPVCISMESENETCSVISHSNTSISCSCPISSHAHGVSSVTDDGSYSVSYVAMLQSVETSFLVTVDSAGHLNKDTLRRGWRAVLTVGLFAAAMLCALFWSNWTDRQQMDKKGAKVTSDADKTNLAADLMNKTDHKKQKKRQRRKKVVPVASSLNFKAHQDLMMIENSLPSILSSRSMSHKVMSEIKQHHRWFGIIFFYCENFPRVLRVISLSTNIVIMLFIQSLTYTLTNGNNGSCEALTNSSDCLAAKSSYATGESKCLWTPTASGDATSSSSSSGSCGYVTPDGNAKIILFVAIFSALISTPLALTVDWMVHHLLAATTDAKLSLLTRQRTAVVAPSRVDTATHQDSLVGSSIYFGLGSRRVSSTALKENKIVQLAAAQSTLRNMTSELLAYRRELEPRQRLEFDLLWGLNNEGEFHSDESSEGPVGEWMKRFRKSRPDVRSLVLNELCDVKVSVDKERVRFTEYLAEDRHKGKRLLYLFQKDLLPGIQGQVLEAKAKRDTFTVRKTSRGLKALAWLFIGLLNAGMLFYILLFALNETEQQQGAWFQSFVLWLCLEIFIASTIIVLVTHVLIPLWTMKDVRKIKETLLASLREFKESAAAQRNHKKLTDDSVVPTAGEVERFNAAKYLFVSTQMALEYPKLKEAQIISHFSTPWPKRSYQHVIDVSKQYSKKFSAIFRSFSVVILYFLTTSISVPPHLQDMVIQTVTTAAVGYTILLHIDLFRIFPLLAFAPLLVCCVLVHFWIQSSKAEAQKRLNLTVSPSNDNLQSLSTIEKDSSGPALSTSSPRGSAGGRKTLRKGRFNLDPITIPPATAALPSSCSSGSGPSPLNRNPQTRSPSLRHSSVSPRAVNNKQHVDRRKSIQQGLATVAALRDVQQQQHYSSVDSSGSSGVISAMTVSLEGLQPLSSPESRQGRSSRNKEVWSDDDSFHRFEVDCEEDSSETEEEEDEEEEVLDHDDPNDVNDNDDVDSVSGSEYNVSLMDSNDFAQLYYEGGSSAASAKGGLLVSTMADRGGRVRARSSMDCDSIDDMMRQIMNKENSFIEEKEL